MGFKIYFPPAFYNYEVFFYVQYKTGIQIRKDEYALYSCRAVRVFLNLCASRYIAISGPLLSIVHFACFSFCAIAPLAHHVKCRPAGKISDSESKRPFKKMHKQRWRKKKNTRNVR